MQVVTEGETYYRYGVLLKKVANFYNNMASQASAHSRFARPLAYATGDGLPSPAPWQPVAALKVNPP